MMDLVIAPTPTAPGAVLLTFTEPAAARAVASAIRAAWPSIYQVEGLALYVRPSVRGPVVPTTSGHPIGPLAPEGPRGSDDIITYPAPLVTLEGPQDTEE